MGTESTTAKQLRLDERNHVEKPLLDQLAGLGWEVIEVVTALLEKPEVGT